MNFLITILIIAGLYCLMNYKKLFGPLEVNTKHYKYASNKTLQLAEIIFNLSILGEKKLNDDPVTDMHKLKEIKIESTIFMSCLLLRLYSNMSVLNKEEDLQLIYQISLCYEKEYTISAYFGSIEKSATYISKEVSFYDNELNKMISDKYYGPVLIRSKLYSTPLGINIGENDYSKYYWEQELEKNLAEIMPDIYELFSHRYRNIQ